MEVPLPSTPNEDLILNNRYVSEHSFIDENNVANRGSDHILMSHIIICLRSYICSRATKRYHFRSLLLRIRVVQNAMIVRSLLLRSVRHSLPQMFCYMLDMIYDHILLPLLPRSLAFLVICASTPTCLSAHPFCSPPHPTRRAVVSFRGSLVGFTYCGHRRRAPYWSLRREG